MQYTHVDPAYVPHPQTHADWPKFWQRVVAGEAMRHFRDALQLDGKPIRDSVLDDLCSYTGCTPEFAIHHATRWGVDAVAEWESAHSDVDAYARETVSAIYSLLWYAYLQAEELYVPLAAGVATAVTGHGSRHLDFGAGVGVTAQVFHAAGYETTLADVATHLLDFARFRLERRNVHANYIDLNVQPLPESSYDVITALDVLSLIPDLPPVIDSLHRALKPGGLLFANFPTSAAGRGAPWHLYDDDRHARRLIQRAGFEPIQKIDQNAGILYRSTNPRTPIHAIRGVRDAVLFGPPRATYRSLVARARALRS